MLTRRLIVLLCVLSWSAVLLPSLALAQAFNNEPPGSELVLNCNMSSQGCPGQYTRGTWYDGYSSLLYQSDATAPFSPSGYAAAKKTYAGACNNGSVSIFESCAVGDHGDDVGWWDTQTHREMFMGLAFRFEAGGQNLAGGTKSFFMRTANVLNGYAQTNSVFYFGGNNATTRQFYWSHNTGGLDNSHTCSASLGLGCLPNIDGSEISMSVWHKLEVCIRTSSTTTSRDGVLAWWVDGTLRGRYTDINYGNGNINEFFWSEAWDGYGNGKAYTGDVYEKLDHVRVSFPLSGGCATAAGASSGSGDTTPPSQVTGVSASNIQASSVVLNWTAATDNVGVQSTSIERCTGTGCSNFATLASVVAPTTTYTDSTLTPGTSYSYRLKAVDTSGNVSVSYSSTVTLTTLLVNLPTITSVTTDANGAVVTWTGSPVSIRVVTFTATSTNLNVIEPISAFAGSTSTPAHVQSRSTTGTASSTALSYASNVTAGNLLVGRYRGGSGVTVTGITDTLGNTWTVIPGATTSSGGGSPITNHAFADFSSTQGLNNWSYLSSAGTALTWNGSFWSNADGYLGVWEDGFHPGLTNDAVRRWTAPQAGSVTITGRAFDLDTTGGCGFGVIVYIKKNGATIWTQTIANGDATGYTFNLSDTVALGDTIDFQVNKNGDDNCDSTGMDPTIVLTPSGGGGYQTMWQAANSLGGPNTVTASLSGSAAYEFDILEYAGVTGTSPLDQAKTSSQTDPGTGANAVTTGNVTTTTDGELVVAATSHVGGSGTTTAAGSSFTIRQNASSHSPIEDRVQSSAGAIAGTFTASNATDDFVTAIATFKPAVTAARYNRVWAAGTTSGCFYPIDALGNENTVSPGYQCRSITPSVSDTTPPVRSNAQPSGTLASGTTSTLISVTTDEPATCKFGSSSGVAYASQPNTMTSNGLVASATVSGLSNGNAYTRYVRCSDVSGNVNTSDTTISFSVAASAGDTTAPSQVVGLIGSAISRTQILLTWTPATDNVGVTNYQVFECTDATCASSSLSTTTALPTATISGLVSGQTHYFQVRALDAVGNQGTFSSSVMVVLSNADVTPPSDLTGLSAAAVDFQTLDLSWTMGTDDMSGVSGVYLEQCEGANCVDFKLVAKTSTSGTTLRVIGLYPKTTYQFRGKNVDGSGNLSANYSTPVQGTTPDVPAGTALGLCPCRQKR